MKERRERVVRKEECVIEGRILTLKEAAPAHAYSVAGTGENREKGRGQIQRKERGP